MKKKDKIDNKKIWKNIEKFFEVMSFYSYKYSFVVAFIVGIYNSVIGTILFIFMLSGFFSHRLSMINKERESIKNDNKNKKR